MPGLLLLISVLVFGALFFHIKAKQGGAAKATEQMIFRVFRLLFPALLCFVITYAALMTEAVLLMAGGGGGGSPHALGAAFAYISMIFFCVALSNGILWGIWCRPAGKIPAFPFQQF